VPTFRIPGRGYDIATGSVGAGEHFGERARFLKALKKARSRLMIRVDTRFFTAWPWLFLSFFAWFAASAVEAAGDDFTLPDLEGRDHSLSDYRGRWVLVNYWATWCPPCLEELPELEVFHKEADGKAVVLGVNMEAIERSQLRDFVERQVLSFPILVASERPSPEQLVGPVDGLPTSYLVAPDGEVVARQVGQVTAEAISAFIADFEENRESGKAL
jgi:thiol-disulfide isomerase/thioredoxin